MRGDNWYDYAACKGYTYLFFPAARERPSQRATREASARQMCETCPVRKPCLAASAGEFGIWAGSNDEERGVTLSNCRGVTSVPESVGIPQVEAEFVTL